MCLYRKKIFDFDKKFIFKNTFKLSLQCLFNVFILFNIVLNLKLNSKQKIDPKMRKFKNLEKIWIILKKFRKKRSGKPAFST